MMGEEPLEVPKPSQCTHTHYYRPQLLDHNQPQPELSWLSTEQTQQSERERALSRERTVNAYASSNPGTSAASSAQVSAGKLPPGNQPRRTRHRVDAGEPRGCFNTNVPNLNHNWGQHPVTQRSSYPQVNRFHPHFIPHQGFPVLQGSRPEPQDPYYFQPMKMLSEFISSANAVAAAQAANTTRRPRDNQLLLREMLCKSGVSEQPKMNNNVYEEESKTPKSKLDGMIGMMMDKLASTPEPEVEQSGEVKEENTETTEEQPSNSAADLLNNNTSEQPQVRNKRKKYQPQRSDLVESDGVGNGVEDLEEFEVMKEQEEIDKDCEESEGRRVTRSQARMEKRDDHDPDTPPSDTEDTPTDFSSTEIKPAAKRKLPEDFLSDIDEDEAMMLRPMGSSSAATTNPDENESVANEYENEEDEQEAMINDDLQHDQDRENEIGSRRTLPVVRNLMRIQNSGSVKEAPLTRQLLTSERPTSTPSASTDKSILRPNLRLEPNGLNNPANSFLNQWKENLKTSLMSHINELVDAQFSLLLSGGMVPPNISLPPHLQARAFPTPDQGRQLRETQKHEHKRTPPPQPPRSHTPREPQQKPMIHLNGGSVLNTEKLQMLQSPPMSDVKKLPVGRASNPEREFGIPPRFPFMQNNERGIPGGQQNGKPHFSSALVGLSNHHLQQQAVAAAVAANAVAAAAGIENMFDNDGALSLVVGNRGGGNPEIGNVTPRKKRHKVTDTRLTPRAVSRLLGQDTTPNPSTSPLYDHPPSQSPQSSPQHQHPIEPRSILQNGTPPPNNQQRTTPQQQTDRQMFNPFHPPTQNPPFFHPAALAAAAAGHPLHPAQLARLESPPMSNSLLHPALQNPNEYVERLREMSMEREREPHHQERNTRVGSDNVVVRDRGEHHHHASLREYPSVRGLRDRSTAGGIMLGNDVLELIGRAGSAGGSDSGGESGSAFELGGGGGGMYCHTTSTLTPMHLRKAKLMFFWTRYPSSAVIKMYFPDIKFNKNNTAQLVKWFSNFREFYYIQMEKYARQALSEGVKQSDDLVVTTDSELYRVLNLHYNRNNHIEVPSNFRYVVEQTLREFFKSIQAGKDSEQSWKKAIYKIIARLDDPVPEYFKSPNFLEQLE